MNKQTRNRLLSQLNAIYSPADAKKLLGEIEAKVKQTKLQEHNKRSVGLKPRAISHSDAVLISYANSIEGRTGQKTPLSSLYDFFTRYNLSTVLPIIHLLPFYPWDTDRGFSVIDYYRVDPRYGSWADIIKLGRRVKLMFDFVANHASINNPLVQKALIARHLSPGDPRYKIYAPYKDFVIAYSNKDKPTPNQLRRLSRPRSTPVLTRYSVFEQADHALRAQLGKPNSKTKSIGRGFVWTTFSRPQKPDGSENTRQVDLNFTNPKVFLEVINILFFYIEQGIDLIRLDAIGYIWKKLNSTSLHEPQAHNLLSAINQAVKSAASQVITIAEVNEPQRKVLTYLGTAKQPEADLVYQFTHFPLAIHAVLTGQATYYNQWLSSTNIFQGRQFITVLGSHDGMGLKPVRGILPENEISKLSDILIKEHGALPNYAALPGGKKIVYEVVATPWHLINNPNSKEPLSTQINRYAVVLALGLLVRGLPAIYINGLFGAPNYLPPQGLDENRTVNRQVFELRKLCDKLNKTDSRERLIMDKVTQLLKIRSQCSAFSPDAASLKVLNSKNSAVTAAFLKAPQPQDNLITLINLSNSQQQISLAAQARQFKDVISRQTVSCPDRKLNLNLLPYQIMWLKKA